MNDWPLQIRKRISLITLIWLIRIIRFFARIMPYRVGVKAGGLIGMLAYYLLRRERNRALEHLSQVYGEKDRSWKQKTALGCFAHLGKSLLENMLMTPERVSDIVALQGMENLQKATEQGRGVVFVTGHIGNWELFAHAVAAKNYPVSVIAAPLKPEQLNDMIIGLRAKRGVRTILRNRPGSSKELIRVFKENRILGILIDQDIDVEGAFVDFLGRPAWTPTAAVSMALKFGAPVIFGYINRGEKDRHTAIIEGPLELIRTNNLERDIIDNTALLTKRLGDCILHNPEQWVWMHRRWRRQP